MPAPLRLRVGINTGLVAVTYPTGRRDVFHVSGDTVNTASRIQSAAPPGGVLVAQATYSHIRGAFDVEAMDPVSAKGKTEPLRTCLILRVRPGAMPPGSRVNEIESPMVGRAEEMGTLQRAYETAMAQRMVSVLVVGEAGMGKSRLLREFERWRYARGPRARRLRGQAFPELTTKPYALLRDHLASHFGIAESDSADEAQCRFEQATAPYLTSEQAQVVGHLLGFDFSSAQAVRHLAGSSAFAPSALAHLWTYLSGLSHSTPLLICLEDLHWADLPSLEIVARMARELRDRRLMLVGTARPSLFERVPSWSEEGSIPFTILPLQPLTAEESHAMVADALTRLDDPGALDERIVEHAGGNPYYLEETIKMLIDDGVIVREAKRWTVQPHRLQCLLVPTTLTGVLQARFDRLSEDERLLLQRAAVVGRYFWDGSIEAMREPQERGIDTAWCLGELQRKGLVFPQHPSRFRDSREYVFKHAMLREVVYETVLLRHRAL